MFIFSRSALIGAVLWAVVVGVNYLKTGKYKDHFAFSVRNYYLLCLVFVTGIILDAIVQRSWNNIALFVVFSLAGVLGETLFSVWWHTFYKEKFWTYRVETLVHSYTSLLNFIPWGMGGFLYLNILDRFAGTSAQTALANGAINLPFYVIFSAALLAGLSLQLLTWGWLTHKRQTHFKFETVTVYNYLFFCFPFVLGLAAIALLYGALILKLALLFGIIAAVAEYAFGKAVEIFISKKLWVYNYRAIDNGHFTLLSLVPFALAGFYFWAVALVFKLLFR